MLTTKRAWPGLISPSPVTTTLLPSCPTCTSNSGLGFRDGERVVLHQEEVSDRLMGVVAGYVHWNGLIHQGAQAVAIVERLFGRQMGPKVESS